MDQLLMRYRMALSKIGTARLLGLPDAVKDVLQREQDLEAKTRMLELIAVQFEGGADRV